MTTTAPLSGTDRKDHDMTALTEHEVTDQCANEHCYSHAVDEPADGAYIVCFECGHVYPSALRLWWDHLRQAARLARKDFRRPLNPPWWAELDIPKWQRGRRAALAMLGRAVVCRPSRISFCQHCVHDF